MHFKMMLSHLLSFGLPNKSTIGSKLVFSADSTCLIGSYYYGRYNKALHEFSCGCISVWNLVSGELQWRAKIDGSPLLMGVSQSHDLLATITCHRPLRDTDEQLSVYDISSGEMRYELTIAMRDGDEVILLKFAENGNAIIIVTLGHVLSWEFATGNVGEFRSELVGLVSAYPQLLDVSENRRMILVEYNHDTVPVESGHRLGLYEIESGRKIGTCPLLLRNPVAVAISTDAEWAVVFDKSEESIIVWRIETNSVVSYHIEVDEFIRLGEQFQFCYNDGDRVVLAFATRPKKFEVEWTLVKLDVSEGRMTIAPNRYKAAEAPAFSNMRQSVASYGLSSRKTLVFDRDFQTNELLSQFDVDVPI